jgi:hypothetical protein
MRRAFSFAQSPKTTLLGGGKEPGLRAASAALVDKQKTVTTR